MIKVSIIIPVFNTPKDELEECIQSITNNNFDDYEILIIDDGSNNVCANLLDSFAEKYEKIKVYHRDNHGVSATRNFGVKVASGKYIMFVDADDILKSNILGEAYDIATKNDADFIIGAIRYISRENVTDIGSCCKSNMYEILRKEERLEIRKYFLSAHKTNKKYVNVEGMGRFEGGPWARLIKRTIALKTPFHEELLIGEDDIWNQELLAKDYKIILDYQIWYNYISSNNFSAMKKYRENIVNEIEKYLESLSEIVLKFEVFPQKEFFNRCLVQMEMLLHSYLLHKDCTMNIFQKIVKLRNILKRNFWKELYSLENIKKLKWKYKIKIMLYKSGLIIPLYYLFTTLQLFSIKK